MIIAVERLLSNGSIIKFMVLYKKLNRAFTLIEFIIYLSIFSIVSIFTVNVILTVLKSYNSFKTVKTLRADAEIALERIGREVKLANDIDLTNSILNVNPGAIYLNTVDQVSGVSKTVEFLKSGDSLILYENGSDIKFLTSSSTKVVNVVFQQISASSSKAVKVDLELKSGKNNFEKSEKFYLTAVLRGSY